MRPSALIRQLCLSSLLAIAVTFPAIADAVEPLRMVGTGGRMGNSFYWFPGSSTSFWQRTPHKLGGPVAEFRVGFMDWINDSKGEVNTDNVITINFAWLERASTGQTVPLTFSGLRQLVMPTSSTTAYWLADALPSSVWTGAAPARDEVFWLHVKGAVSATGEKIPIGTPTTYAGAKFIAYDPANDPGTLDVSGAVPSISGSITRLAGLPVLFTGRYTGPGHLSVIGLGDSILDGFGDGVNPAPVIAGTGFFNRAAVDANGNNTIAMLNVTRSGETANTWVNNHARQAQLLPFANVVVEEFGTNDIGSNGSAANAATIYARLESIWNTARSAGVQKIVRTRLLPRTSSSDQWKTFANQTPNPGWGAGGARDQLNALLDTSLASGKIDMLVDTLASVRAPEDDHYWITTGSADYPTADGTHPRWGGHILLAFPLRAALETLTVDDVAPSTYAAWSASVAWEGADSSSLADPNNDGVTNLLAYALDLPPLTAVSPVDLPFPTLDITPDGPWLSLTYRENTSATDLIYAVQTSTDLSAWSTLVIDGINVVAETIDSDPDDDGTALLHRVRLKLAANEPRRFLRLNASIDDFVIGAETLLDNTSASGVTFSPGWLQSTSTTGYHGANYSHDNNTNKGSETATYTPSLAGSGSREVYVRWTSATNRASNARYIVTHADGSEVVLKNQRTGGGAWVKLGTWNFNAGSAGNVVISNTGTDGYVIADALRFVNVAP